MNAWMVVGLLVSLVFSGCAQRDKAGSGAVPLGDGTSVQLAQPDNEAGRGSISGVVVDEAIRPLPGVNITLLAANRTVATDETGLFVLENLDPGLYTLSARPGTYAGKRFLGVQTTAEVAAGETAKVRMVLPADNAPVPYHGATMKFEGFYQVASGFADEVLDLFVWNQTYGPVTFPNGCTCRFDFLLDSNANLTMVVLELLWDEAVDHPHNDQLGGGWTMDLVDSKGDGPLLFCDAEKQYAPPCIIRAGSAGNFSAEGGNFSVGVWSDPSWAYAQEKFTLFVTPFYVAPAPDDWAFLNGDT